MEKSKMKIIEDSVCRRIHNGIEKERLQFEITKEMYLGFEDKDLK